MHLLESLCVCFSLLYIQTCVTESRSPCRCCRDHHFRGKMLGSSWEGGDAQERPHGYVITTRGCAACGEQAWGAPAVPLRGLPGSMLLTCPGVGSPGVGSHGGDRVAAGQRSRPFAGEKPRQGLGSPGTLRVSFLAVLSGGSVCPSQLSRGWALSHFHVSQDETKPEEMFAEDQRGEAVLCGSGTRALGSVAVLPCPVVWWAPGAGASGDAPRPGEQPWGWILRVARRPWSDMTSPCRLRTGKGEPSVAWASLRNLWFLG